MADSKNEETTVMGLACRDRLKWRGEDEVHWYSQLLMEVGGLGRSLGGDLEETPDSKLKQIAAICINWLEMRREAHRG